jgi:outer membrane protein assembly factor BamB
MACASDESVGSATPDIAQLGLSGGLGVEIGSGDTEFLLRLARTGRFIVQSLDRDAAAVARTRAALESQAVYGIVSALHWTQTDRLPYAENLINLLVLRENGESGLPLKEVVRVACPGGLVLVPAGRFADAALTSAGLADVRPDSPGGRWLVARKPWPAGMDQWSHPWHGADGNTVSQDTFVGPPRRVRWVNGPSVEVSSVVSAAGRNYYGGVWVRDAFNGLRLWEEPLKPSPSQGGFDFGATAGSVRPIAVGDGLLVSSGGEVRLLDGATGRVRRTYPEVGRPHTLLHVQGTLLAVAGQELRAVAADTGRLRWTCAAVTPRLAVTSGEAVFFLEGNVRQGDKVRAVCVDLATGTRRWQRDDYPWLPLVRRLVAHRDLVVFEVSTVADAKEGNAIHVASAADGAVLWSRTYVPGMNHMKQARAMFISDALWILEHLQCVQLNPRTGEVKQRHRAGLCHCFPPVATSRYMFSGEMDLTDLATGQVDAHRITKAHCGRDFGWLPANGLIYTSPKHCVCWPMLRGYVALAPAGTGDRVREIVDDRQFALEKGCEPPADAPADSGDWPCFRHDAWRSGATARPLPNDLRTLWTTSLGSWPDCPITRDWRENPFVRGPLTAPVAADGKVCVARPDAHQVVALDLASGAVAWRFTADGRVDTPPTLHGGLCLFGTKRGSVYALRADDGRLVWRLGAAPTAEQIVAYGQIESPWPVPGSVLVIDHVVYFAAGRHPLADGGILLFAVEPRTGQVRWVKRIDALPMTDFYACIGLEFDNFDLLHQEGDAVAMSRWLFDRRSGKLIVNAADAFARLSTGGAGPGVVVQRGVWTYAPRNQVRFDPRELLPRPLAAFRDSTLVGCLPDQRTLYRRDFDAEAVAKFNTKWITGWAASENARKKTGDVWPVDRLAKDAQWSAPLLGNAPREQRIAALVLAGDRAFVAGTAGGLLVVGLDDGRVVARAELPAPIWDGMAAAGGRLLVSTSDGRLVCLGGR